MSDIDRMIAGINKEVAYTQRMIGKDALDPRVMKAMRKVPRQDFVPEDLQKFAFDNGPLPIGFSQTISQPYIVALMTDLLEPKIIDSILEIGTGSGYQTAILSLLVREVYSMETIKDLSEQTTARLRSKSYKNITTCVGNGYKGWPEHSPYDGIIVTAAATHIPPALVDQLKPGGRLIIPVGLPNQHQELMVLTKNNQGLTETNRILAVSFVPMVDTPKKDRDLS